MAKDRAAAVTTTVLAIISSALREWMLRGGGPTDVRAQVETFLRGEFADLAREVRGERDGSD
jgi:hypothetical protein